MENITETFISPTYGNVTFKEILEIMNNYYMKNKDYGNFNIVIGTDSQNFSDTKVVSVIKNSKIETI